MTQVSIEDALTEYRNYLESVTYELMITKAALKNAERQLAEKTSEADTFQANNT